MITTNQIYKKVKDAYQEHILVSKEFNVIVAICNLRKIVVCDYKTGEVRFEKKFPLSTNFFRCTEYQGYCIITDTKYCIFLSLSDYQIYNPLDYFSDTDYVRFLGVVKNTCYLQLSRKDQPLLIADVGIFLPNNQTFTRVTDLFPQFSSCAFLRQWDNIACFDYHVGEDLYYKSISIYRLTDDLLPLPNPELKLGQLSGYFSIKVAFTYAGYIYFYAYTEEKPLDCVILQTDYSGNIINRFNHPNRNNYEGFKMGFAADLVSLKDGMSIVCRCTFHNIAQILTANATA